MSIAVEDLRRIIVSSIVRIDSSFEGRVSRNSIFLAVSILDFFLRKISCEDEIIAKQLKNPCLCAICCLILAWKFQGEPHPTISELIQKLYFPQDPQTLKNEVFILEEFILTKIDFMIPSETAYEFLDKVVNKDEMSQQEARRDVARSLKIMLTAIQITNDLSFNPLLGSEIHLITKRNKNCNQTAKNIYRNCLKLLQNQQEIKLKCSKTF